MAERLSPPQIWRNKMLNLEGEICPDGHIVFPKRDICPHCGNEANELIELSGKGEVYSFTTIYEAPSGFEENSPYTVGLIKLDEGPLITAQLTDLDPNTPLEIGAKVEMVTRKLSNSGDTGIIKYGWKFRPTSDSG